MYRAIIIDDEAIGINALKVLIEKHVPSVRIIASSVNPEEGIRLIEDYRPDILFLDISMPKMDGFELLEKLNFRDFKLIFTTAHEEYALKAIKNKAFDYLLKPIDIEELKASVNNLGNGKVAKSFVEKGPNRLIELAVKDGIIFIKPEEIIRLEASGSYTTFHCVQNTKHLASKNLKEFETTLDPVSFFRCHMSHIVNLHHVVKLISGEGLMAKMTDGSQVEIAKRNKQLFLDRLKQS